MTRKSFIVLAAIALASFAAGGCDSQAEIETPVNIDSMTEKPEWGDTITIRFSFGERSATRGTAEEAKVTDIWLLDFVNGELRQTIHQQITDDGFGTLAMAATYGKHALRLVASAGTGAAIADSIITWTKPADTFYSADTIDIEPQGAKSVNIQLRRIATRLRVTVNDEIPADFATLGITSQWFYGLNAKSGEAVSPQTVERTVSIPASMVGTTGQLSAGFYSLCPIAGYKSDVTIRALKSDDTELRKVTLTDVPFMRNRMTAYSGTLFDNTRSMSLDFDLEWADAFEGSW